MKATYFLYQATKKFVYKIIIKEILEGNFIYLFMYFLNRLRVLLFHLIHQPKLLLAPNIFGKTDEYTVFRTRDIL